MFSKSPAMKYFKSKHHSVQDPQKLKDSSRKDSSRKDLALAILEDLKKANSLQNTINYEYQYEQKYRFGLSGNQRASSLLQELESQGIKLSFLNIKKSIKYRLIKMDNSVLILSSRA